MKRPKTPTWRPAYEDPDPTEPIARLAVVVLLVVGLIGFAFYAAAGFPILWP
jgi:hypothetical protein